MSTKEDDWKIFEIHKESMASISRSQSRFLAGLLTFLTVLWGRHFVGTNDALVLAGIQVSPDLLWTTAPFALAILNLSLIGSLNLMGPVWGRLSTAATRLGIVVFFTDMDPHKTLIDYFVKLKVNPEGPVEPVSAPVNMGRKGDWYVFSYPLVIAVAVYSTFVADYADAPLVFKTYVYASGFLQSLFAIRIWYRAVCRFFGIRRSQTEV